MSSDKRISREQAGELLDFGGRRDAHALSRQLIDSQLDGAVAAHNLLQERGVAYVADEVGTGKTLVAAGVLALLRHDDPSMRALVIAPRANLQEKWRRELRSFARENVRFTDMRVRAISGEPARPPRTPGRLSDVLRTWAQEPHCDIISRLSSFQLGHRRGTAAERATYVDSWREALAATGSAKVRHLLDDAATSRDDVVVKETVAACVNRLLPEIGVLVVDEAHNLKGGVSGAARNRVLWTLLGHNSAFTSRVPGYGPRVERVLMLSATPMEDRSDQLLAQLEVLGVADRVPDLGANDEETRLASLHSFLFRRLTKMRVADQVLTRNRYREEWRAGGTRAPREPLPLTDARAKLTFAVVQKKVADVLNNGGGGPQFQIGMLTSFESLAESTSHLAQRKNHAGADGEDERHFDDVAQNNLANEEERRGIDSAGIRKLVTSHEAEFGRPPVHPKMDAVVDRLVAGARQGRKALVFTRRVASVDEMVQRVNDRIDADLECRLRDELPEMYPDLDRLMERYRMATTGSVPGSKAGTSRSGNDATAADDTDLTDDQAPAELLIDENPDAAGTEVTDSLRGGRSLFAWLFRESPPEGLLTGWWLRQRLEQQSGGYVTLLRDNHVAAVLSCEPKDVLARLRDAVSDVENVAATVDALAQQHLGLGAQVPTVTRFRAAQLAGLQLLAQHGPEEVRERAASALEVLSPATPTSSLPRLQLVSVSDRLSEATLATALRGDRELCSELWHDRLPWDWDGEEDFRRREWRWRLLTAAVRLDYPAIDLWLCEVRRNGSLTPADGRLDAEALIRDFLTTLRRQRESSADSWTSYAALHALRTDADLVLEVNGVQPGEDAVPPWVGNRFPAMGMSGQVNGTAVRQFRTPTYPLVMISTDLLQEGEDLHTFCDEVHHYGIAWMPSSLEQRTGRVDRVNSLTERRLSRPGVTLDGDGRPHAEERLQVLYPFLSGTYEGLQVNRVLNRLNEHIRLLHESFGQHVGAAPKLDPNEVLAEDAAMPAPQENLREPYKIADRWLVGRRSKYPLVHSSLADEASSAFSALLERSSWGPYRVDWLTRSSAGLHLLGECFLKQRRQPLDLRLISLHGRAAIRIISPVGLLDGRQLRRLASSPARVHGPRIGVVRMGPRDRRSFSVTVEDLLVVPARKDVSEALNDRVTHVLEQADALEAHVLAADLPLTDFAEDLYEEVRRG